MGSLVVLFDHNNLLVSPFQVTSKPPSHVTTAGDNDFVNRDVMWSYDFEERSHVGRPPDAVDRVLDLKLRVPVRQGREEL